MVTTKSLTVQGVEVSLTAKGDEDYISLTDMVTKFEGGSVLIESWLRNKDTVEFLGVWERLNNPSFNSPGFEGISRLEETVAFEHAKSRQRAVVQQVFGIRLDVGRNEVQVVCLLLVFLLFLFRRRLRVLMRRG